MKKTHRPLYTDIYRYTIASINSIKIIIESFFLLGPRQWLSFWLTRESQTRVSLGPVHDFFIRTHTIQQKIVDLYMAKSCIVDNQYNPRKFELQHQDTIIDIGGHIGSFAVLAATRAPQGRIFTFEPDPNNFAQLEKNTKRYSNVQATQKAVSASVGSITLFQDSLNSAENSVFKQGGTPFSVQSTTIEEIFRDNNIQTCNFMKIDCEGAEYDILYTMPAHILGRIEKIALEAHHGKYFDIEKETYSPQYLLAYLQKNGFKTSIQKENAMHSLIWARRA